MASAIRAVVAVDRRCSPADVGIAVLGVPARGFVIPWSEASIGGFALERALSQADLVRLEARCDKLWPPGPRTLAVAAASMAEAVIHAGRRLVSVFAATDGELGPRNTVVAMPVFLGPNGIAARHAPTLSVRERTRLGTVSKG
jgi:malate/lactate dehydrogenase